MIVNKHMTTGWQFVIGGRKFDPTEFLKSCRIQPTTDWKEGVGDDSERCVDFCDWHDGPYPLAMETEALDFLREHIEEIRSLLNLEGVERRELHFIDDGGSGFLFESSSLSLLGELGITVSICVLNQGSN